MQVICRGEILYIPTPMDLKCCKQYVYQSKERVSSSIAHGAIIYHCHATCCNVYVKYVM